MKIKCLTIAGFDGSGGAGIQADLKTFSALGCYGMTVLTALPVQNTCGVRNCYEIPLQAIQEQLETIFEDIVPDSIKVGMLFSSPIIELVADFLKKYCQNIPVVVDPVMVAKSGDPLLQPTAVESLKRKLIPLSTILTPNLPEAQALVGDLKVPEKLSAALIELGPRSVLLKGGHSHQQNTCDDLFMTQQGDVHWLKANRIHTKNTHGTGCTLSSAICSFLAQGFTPLEACQKAKEYLLGAIEASKENSVGHGHGPVHHFYQVWKN